MQSYADTIVVAQDGSGDFTTVQAAIDAVPDSSSEVTHILVKKGRYKEVITIPPSKQRIHLKGESAEETVLTYDNYAKRLRADGTEYGTSKSASFFAQGDDFVAEDLTFENTAGITAGQALAINISAPHSKFLHCRFLGHQDTWYAANGTYQYLEECYLEGSVDFIFGGSTAFFDRCVIASTRDGYITAASTPEGQEYGYVFYQCQLIPQVPLRDDSVYLGRPWRPYAKVVFVECTMESHIRKVGWHNWSKVENESTAYYAEYGSKDAGAAPSERVSWSHQLTAEQVSSYTKEKVLAGWESFQ